MTVLVSRSPGDKPGPNIVDSVLTTRDAQTERGRGEINENGVDRVLESGTIIGTEFKKPGKIVKMIKDEGATNHRLTHFNFTVVADPFSLTSSINTEGIKE